VDGVLVDTSAWLDVLARGRATTPLAQRVDALLAADQAATADVIRAEMLRGAYDTAAYRRLERLLAPLRCYPVERTHWDAAAQLGFRLRRAGITISLNDLLVATVAITAGIPLLHQDRHFVNIARHSTLIVETYRDGHPITPAG
jgi:predicted nucleic acid-binding protein